MTATVNSTKLGTQAGSSDGPEIRPASGSVVIAKNVADMRASPDRSSELVSQAVLGQVVLTYDETPGWFRIRTSDEYSGWVESRWTVADIRGRGYASSGKIARISNLYAELLTWPDPAADIITKAVVGTELETAEIREDWVIVRLPDGKPGAVKRFAVELLDRAVFPLPLSPTGSEIAATAKRFIGVPYLWGGVTAFGLDCSGLAQLVHKLHGVFLPRDSYLQAECNLFNELDEEALQPGDLLFFGNPGGSIAGRSITHVAIALGPDKFIHSAGGAGVVVSETADAEYKSIFRMAKRLI
ncbi:MAG: C40 family peptidase [Armatimonadota bacterium]|nr:C40 family peptidase [Armatimonadota bacterium]